MSDDLPVGVLAYREYEIPAPGGGTASIAFTLRRADATPMGDFTRRADARAHGLVSLVDYPGAPRRPAIWLQTDTELQLTGTDEELSEESKQLIARHLAVFFSDVAAIAPELAAIRPRCAARGPVRASVVDARRQRARPARDRAAVAPPATDEPADTGYPRLEQHIRRYDTESASARLSYRWTKYLEWACVSLVPAAALVHGPTAAVLGAIVIVLEGVQPLNGWHYKWITARWTAGRLRHERYCYLSRSGQYAGLNDKDARRRLALTVEGLLSTNQPAIARPGRKRASLETLRVPR